jgi:hypothetical protein
LSSPVFHASAFAAGGMLFVPNGPSSAWRWKIGIAFILLVADNLTDW